MFLASYSGCGRDATSSALHRGSVVLVPNKLAASLLLQAASVHYNMQFASLMESIQSNSILRFQFIASAKAPLH